MLTVAQNDRLSRVGPGTPCGELMRRYWHPVAAASQLKDRYTMPVRLLGEDLILYKDRSGVYGLIDPYCPHRRMNMIYGIPEENGLRCPYHGWCFDETGQCIEQPYEEAEGDSRFKEKIRTRAYPVREQAGLLMAYLGPDPAPLLPNWDVYAMPNVVRDIGYAMLPCNWLQCQENSLDPVHLEWLHSAFTNYVLERLERPERVKQKKHAKIGFDVFEYGIVKRRVVEGGSESDTAWADGHPIVFPNMLRQGGSGDGTPGIGGMSGPAFQIRTPIDDNNTAHWWVACYPRLEGEAGQEPEDIPMYFPVVPDLTPDGQPRWEILDSNSAQDPAAWITQGQIADRSQEHLGRSDRGIILYRQMLEENIALVERGEDPMNTFRDPDQNVYLSMRTERPVGERYAGTLTRQGAATKYSPILNARGVAKPLEGGPLSEDLSAKLVTTRS
jgi:5,5'-dehydrodivanillate O-demethylase oxygenase subunit